MSKLISTTSFAPSGFAALDASHEMYIRIGLHDPQSDIDLGTTPVPAGIALPANRR